jgi:hypothetical protein
MIWNNSSIFLFSDNLTKFSNTLSPNHLAQLFLKIYDHLSPLPYKIFFPTTLGTTLQIIIFSSNHLTHFRKKLFRSPDNLTKLFIFFSHSNSLYKFFKKIPSNQLEKLFIEFFFLQTLSTTSQEKMFFLITHRSFCFFNHLAQQPLDITLHFSPPQSFCSNSLSPPVTWHNFLIKFFFNHLAQILKKIVFAKLLI